MPKLFSNKMIAFYMRNMIIIVLIHMSLMEKKTHSHHIYNFASRENNYYWIFAKITHIIELFQTYLVRH